MQLNALSAHSLANVICDRWNKSFPLTYFRFAFLSIQTSAAAKVRVKHTHLTILIWSRLNRPDSFVLHNIFIAHTIYKNIDKHFTTSQLLLYDSINLQYFLWQVIFCWLLNNWYLGITLNFCGNFCWIIFYTNNWLNYFFRTQATNLLHYTWRMKRNIIFEKMGFFLQMMILWYNLL